ncbi:MAG: hypothetical protein GY811_10330 [Myxococcales bacterium]|nr:hypothetical protein [Myxococcales bacterium]
MRAPTLLGALGGHSAEHQQVVFGAAVVVFVLVIGGLVALYRARRERAEMEDIDALLREEDTL